MRLRAASSAWILCLLALTDVTPSAAALKVFVTSATHNGNFGGILGADAFCQSAADGATQPLPGTFKAWLSNDVDDAYCRVAGFAGKVSGNCGQAQLPDAGPWERVDGQPFARGLKALTTFSAILTPGSIDENGLPIAPSPTSGSVYTGTTFGGTYLGGAFNTCGQWTIGDDTSAVRSGIPFSGPFYWTDYSQLDLCDVPQHLYCFEVGPSIPLGTFEYDGGLAFISSVSHDGDYGGLAGADTFCQGLAADADLPNASSFAAWLSTSSVDAIDRLTWDGPYKRVDGVQVAANKADLVDAGAPANPALSTGLWVTESGVSNYFFTLTGTGTDGTADVDTCNDWESNLNSDHAEFGMGTSSLGYWTQSSTSPVAFLTCNAAIYYLYCFSNVPILFWDNFEEFPYLQRWSAVVP